MAQIFTNMPQLLGRVIGPVPMLLGRFGAINTNDEVFTPAPTASVSDTMQAMQKATLLQVQNDAPQTRTLAPQGCPACPKLVEKKTWPWLLFVGLGSAAVAVGVTAAAVGSREKRR